MASTVRANMTAAEQDKLPEEEVIAQISYVMFPRLFLDHRLTLLVPWWPTRRTFIFAAMDTTSNALAITLMLLGEHPDVQQRLRDEILEAFDEQQNVDYDKLVSLPYLDAVCRETLRLCVASS